MRVCPECGGSGVVGMRRCGVRRGRVDPGLRLVQEVVRARVECGTCRGDCELPDDIAELVRLGRAGRVPVRFPVLVTKEEYLGAARSA